MEASNLPDTESLKKVIMMLKKLSENHNSIKKQKTIKNNYSEMKNAIFEVKNTLEGIN